jgi:hypothetical protein
MSTPNSIPAAMPTQAGATQFDPAKLADIHLPGTISLWPIAPGWWILLTLILLIVVVIIFLKKSSSGKKAVTDKEIKSQAMIELMALNEEYKKHAMPHKTVKQLSVFLRRYALSLYQRENVASLTDAQWLTFLDTMLESDLKQEQTSSQQLFSQKFSDLLTKAPYQAPDKSIDKKLLAQLFQTAKKLINTQQKVAGRV